MKTILIAALLLVSAGRAKADTWTYTGREMSGCNCSLNGSVTIAGNISDGKQLDAVAWSFTDGTHTLTQDNSVAGFSENNHQGGPAFSDWYTQITGSQFSFISYFYGSHYEATDISFADGASSDFGYWQGFYTGELGTWTPVSTPEPSALALVLIGLGLAICIAGRYSLKRLA